MRFDMGYDELVLILEATSKHSDVWLVTIGDIIWIAQSTFYFTLPILRNLSVILKLNDVHDTGYEQKEKRGFTTCKSMRKISDRDFCLPNVDGPETRVMYLRSQTIRQLSSLLLCV